MVRTRWAQGGKHVRREVGILESTRDLARSFSTSITAIFLSSGIWCMSRGSTLRMLWLQRGQRDRKVGSAVARWEMSDNWKRPMREMWRQNRGTVWKMRFHPYLSKSGDLAEF
jgi:hypothetical protein